MKRPFEILVVVMTIVVQLNALDSCPEVTCPDGCERETGAQQHRCPWCVCHPIAARKTLEKFEQRHCPKELVEFVKTQSGHLKEHVFKLSDTVRQQKVLLKNFGKLHVPQIPTTGRKQCPTPICNTNCTLVTGDHGCPDCECPPTHCPRKKCPPGCHRETGILHDRCPECVCEAEMQVVHALQCATPLCAPNCTLVTGDHGCPDCECPPTHCPRKKCPPGCHRETGILHDRCPECVCEAEMQRVHPLQCATPMCARNCILVTGDHGCPDCECPPTHCPRKKCPPGCHRETGILHDRCPECVCEAEMQRVHPLQCATPMCARNCILVTGDHGCPDCECPPTHCPRKKCPPGCHRETGILHDRCPECVCEAEMQRVHPLQCATPMCAPNCTLVTGDHGCPDCECPPTHCPRKKCPPGCHRETGILHDRCPECVCEADTQTVHPLQCATPMCAPNCTLVTGDHGCPDCECPPTHCPRKKCPPGCHRETGILHDRCPECACEAEMQRVHPLQCATPMCARNCTLVTGDHGCPDCECPPTHCPRKKCPPGCHRATGILHDRCPECVCEADTQTVHPLQCATPMCAPNCTLVTGDHGCPDCECPPTHCPRKRCPQNCHRETRVTGNRCPECVCDGDAGAEVTPSELHGRPKRDEDDSSEESSEEKTGTTQSRQKRDTPKRRGDDSSEESSEESSEDNHVHKERSRDSSEEIRTRPLRTYRSKRHHHFGALRKKHNTSVHHQPVAFAGQVQCTPPVCEAYCTTKPGPHGCLACDCPDVCPEIVCGDGCHPEYTEHRKCERCVCNPQSERQTMADVFYSHCGEGSLRTLLIDFVNLKKTLEILERQLKEHDEEISKIEDRHGITEPVGSDHAHDHASLHHHGQHHGHHGQHHGHHGNPLGDHHHDHHRGHH
ncbi:kielin/chordin-like protein isoform X2 [Ornithodoros turicata]|uniref:kielin/chordin-like protein isoform X2 n=1 Tax=Ornithodoros turicata TaxID=34597 RepID=UPI00313975E0